MALNKNPKDWATDAVYLLAACISPTVIFFANYNSFEDWQTTLFLIYIGVFCLIIFFKSFLTRFILTGLSYFKKGTSDFIYNNVTTRLEYLNKEGTRVSYKREQHVTDLSIKRSKRKANTTITIHDGSIDRKLTSAANATFNWPSSNSVRFQTYFDDNNIIKNEYYSCYYSFFENAFSQKEEFWFIRVKRYCRFYRFVVVLAEGLELKDYQCVEVEKYNTEKDGTKIIEEKEKPSPYIPSVTYRNGRYNLVLTITGFNENVVYKLKWTLA